MAIFYHVSTDLNHNGVFTPRIPQTRHGDSENETIPRVCVGETIEDCLTAIPNGGGNLEDFNDDIGGFFKIFKIDTEKLNIREKDIISNEFLFQEDLVRDADITNEYWILTDFKVDAKDSFLIKLLDWREEVIDVIPYSIIALGEDALDDYLNDQNERIPCAIQIVQPNYIYEEVKKGDIITFPYGDYIDEEEISFILSEYYHAKILTNESEEIVFEMTKDCNLRDFFKDVSYYIGYIA